MSGTFTASNGVVIEIAPEGHLLMPPAAIGLGEESQQALRELFLHERDKELGRWRWPENPDYVVYPDGTSRTVVKESVGRTMIVSHHARKVMTTYLDSYVGAAKAYDAAHPEPRPWRDAKPGEVWALIVDGVEKAFTLHGDLFRTGNLHDIEQTDGHITAGRRIWPEVPSE